MNSETNERTFTSIVLAPIARKLRFFVRARKDKLQLLLLMVAGSAIPAFLCWGLPSLINAARTNQAEQAVLTAEVDQEAFRANNPNLIALCNNATPGEASGTLPDSPSLVIVRNSRLDELQSSIPDRWRAETANIVLCLDREHIDPVEACLDGSTPDLSMFEGYELLIGIEPSFEFARNHPEVSGRTILRYVTDYALIDIESGEVIDSGQINGSDPPICREQPEVSLLETMTGEALREEVLYYINGEQLTTEGFNAWLGVTLSPD